MWQDSATQWTPENVGSGPTLRPGVLLSLQDLRFSGREGHGAPPELQVCFPCFRFSGVSHGLNIFSEEFQK